MTEVRKTNASFWRDSSAQLGVHGKMYHRNIAPVPLVHQKKGVTFHYPSSFIVLAAAYPPVPPHPRGRRNAGVLETQRN